jgi:transcriptional regulator with XRE-family HTH domain|nr:MAG TPA: helix-turn-helix domain protein [Caudoviricetes sp.]
MTIKEYREELGMTQAQLAAALGVAQNHISRWERGTVNPSADTLRKMADIFSCRMDDITPAVKKLKAKDIFTREAYEGLTADQRRRELKVQQACEYSGWRGYPTTMHLLVERIPAEWWDMYSAQQIGETMALLKAAYDDGVAFGREHPEMQG